MRIIKELYDYREMISNLVKKDLKVRYKGSILGFLWTFLNPLLQLVVYTIVFSTIMRVDIDKYYIYLFVGLIPWIFFASSIQVGAVSIMMNKDLIKKIYFPRIILPIVTSNSAFMNMFYSMIVVLLTILVSGIGFSKYMLLLPVVMVVQYILVLGMTFIFSALNVFFRDLEYILNIIVMMWFYLTPIVYNIDMIPERHRFWFYLNPMTGIINFYRDILYYKRMPSFNSFGGILIYGIIMIIIGYFVFEKLQKNFAEEL
ncbi:ABC transporter permease [Leptotrichia sp. oral taxon 417]|jgi:lipopolysaccharide transport system permease protein|uniref:ABC transporter permease n=1 Tax=Leptotrichia sp. oral taxon 417 TaxID=712365 RepID=UPI0015BA4C2F|nr:ABC transporter permease [Leptotrichia sp. oral taxon 417]NWO26311.1 ABC transporter permease [Leptotrichia sp. oral taxon 417]